MTVALWLVGKVRTRVGLRIIVAQILGAVVAGFALKVVFGGFDGGDTAFDSEMWMDADEARSVFDRENYSSVLARVTGDAAAHSLTNRIDTD